MKNRRTIGWAGAGVLLAVISVLVPGCGKWSKKTETGAEPVVAIVQSGPLTVTVKATGDIRPVKASKIIPRVRRPSTLEYIVPEGTRVKAGDVIARFNTDDIDRRIKDTEEKDADLRSKLYDAMASLEIQRLDNNSILNQAVQDVDAARQELKKLEEGDTPMDRRTADLKIRTARSDLGRKTKRHQELQSLLKEGFVTEDEVEEARMGMDTAGVEMETANLEMKLLNDYTLPLKRMALEAALKKANAELDKTRKQNEARLRNRKQAVENAEWVVKQAEADLAEMKADLQEYVVKATNACLVVYGDLDDPARRTLIQVGTTIYPGQVLITIPDMSAMLAVVNVSEADVRRVAPGQRAEVVVDAISSRPIGASVLDVAEVANSSAWYATDVKEFKVRLALKDSRELKPGFSCQASIVVDHTESTLFLPVQSVFREGEQYFVYPVGGLTKSRAEVKIGRYSDRYIEIVSGVSKGSRVYVVPPAIPSN